MRCAGLLWHVHTTDLRSSVHLPHSYASRKAYAEARPRVKGRFAKRGELPGAAAEEGTPSGGGTASAGATMDALGLGGLGDLSFLPDSFGADMFGSAALMPPLAWLSAQGVGRLR